MDRYIPHFLITAGIAVCCWAFLDDDVILFAVGLLGAVLGARELLADSNLGEGGE
jgi:hypothetical protein